MKYKRTEKFAELDCSGNWAGLGKDIFFQLEGGKSVECNPPASLIEGKYIVSVNKKKDKE